MVVVWPSFASEKATAHPVWRVESAQRERVIECWARKEDRHGEVTDLCTKVPRPRRTRCRRARRLEDYGPDECSRRRHRLARPARRPGSRGPSSRTGRARGREVVGRPVQARCGDPGTASRHARGGARARYDRRRSGSIRESDQALVEAHRCLRKEYQKLGEHEGLDLNSGDLFLCARQRKLFHSLTLHDEVNPGAPVPVLPLPDYLPNLLQVTGDKNWVASACSWDGLSALYETSEPKSGPPGRSLVLYGSDYRTDLRHLDTTKLNQPPGPPDPSPPEFVVQAAETTS